MVYCSDYNLFSKFYKYKMSVAVFIHAPKVVNKKVIDGMLMYPTNIGHFKSAEDRDAFSNLFEGNAPPVPYGGLGKKYGPEEFALKEVQGAVLEHMKKNFSLPKDPDAYWEIDGETHNNLVFHASVVNGKIYDEETDIECAIRTTWEWTGMKIDPKELVRACRVESMVSPMNPEVEESEMSVDVFHVYASIDRAKYDWITHQAERRTLTDTEVTPYPSVLTELGIPDVVHTAYCKTHGGPRFMASESDVKDPYTQRLMAEARIVI